MGAFHPGYMCGRALSEIMSLLGPAPSKSRAQPPSNLLCPWLSFPKCVPQNLGLQMIHERRVLFFKSVWQTLWSPATLPRPLSLEFCRHIWAFHILIAGEIFHLLPMNALAHLHHLMRHTHEHHH